MSILRLARLVLLLTLGYLTMRPLFFQEEEEVEDLSLLKEPKKENIQQLARVWKRYPFNDWCSNGGLVLIKVPKSASSTVTGMVLRMTANSTSCPVDWQHGLAREKEFNSSFVMAPIRLPHTRALSSVYFHHVSFHRSKRQDAISDAFILRQLEKTAPNYILDYTQTTTTTTGDDLQVAAKLIRQALQAYHFWMVVERWHESVVVLAWLVDLPITRLLTLDSKRSGNQWYLVHNPNQRKKPYYCIALQAPVYTPAISNYFDSTKWRKRHAGDYLLHAVANTSLTKTIDAIGKDWVQNQVELLKSWQSRVVQTCAHLFPCSTNGTPQMMSQCYLRDFGCGHACIDRLVVAAAG